jgi:glycosyltransferase involved in cell wall biosynthesis
MKIYHGPQNIGGMAGVLASAQREIGFSSTSCCYTTGNFRYKSDQEIVLNNNYKKRFWELLKLLIKTIVHYDVFQFYFGESITGPLLLELPLLKKLGKKIYFYFCGCDIRDSKVTIENYKYSACKECWPMACSANRKTALHAALKYANGIFVSTPDLLEFIPKSVLLPQPIDMRRFESMKESMVKEKSSNRIIKVAHAPSNRKMKGTQYVEEAITTLQASGYSIELLLVENISYEEALNKCANADIVVDQLLIGSYGQYSVEMMALGKPVICYLRDDLVQHYGPDLPIINANPSNIIEILKNLIDRKSDWGSIGQQGVRYVEENHDSRVIAKKLMETYKK